MVMHNLARIARALIAGGIDRKTPAAVIAAATTAEERILVSTLGGVAADARAQGFEPPAIVVVGEVVAVRERLAAMTTAAKAVR
jgi:uroporphyrin-III C-methyltransferase